MYSDLKESIRHWLQGIYEIMIVEGMPGTGKSSAIRQALSNTSHLWLEGRTSAPAFYELLYQYQDLPIVLDDADSFIADKQCLNLLKTLCQTDQYKAVQWHTLRKLPQDMPQSFHTASTVCIITNAWSKMSKHLSAVVDRGIYIQFQPSKEEIHQQAGILCDSDIWSFFDFYLHIIENLSLRQYVIPQRMKDQGIEWRKYTVESWGLEYDVSCYLKLEIEYPHWPESEKKAKFVALGFPEKTYERVKRQLQGKEAL
jgi:hypothetical protein